MFNYSKLTFDSSVANVINLTFTGGTKALYAARFVDKENKIVTTPTGVEINLTKSIGTCEIEVITEANSDFSNITGLKITYYGESVTSQTIPLELINSGFTPNSLTVDKSGGEYNITFGLNYQPTWEDIEITNGSLVSVKSNTCSRDIVLKIDSTSEDRDITLTVAYNNSSSTLVIKQLAKDKPNITVEPTYWNATTDSSTTQKFTLSEAANFQFANLPDFIKEDTADANSFTLRANRRASKEDFTGSFICAIDKDEFTIEQEIKVFQEGCYLDLPVTNIIAKFDQTEVYIPFLTHNISSGDCSTDNTDWIEKVSYESGNKRIKLTLSENEGDLRKQSFDLTVKVNNQILQVINITVVQLSEDQSDIPVWEDTEYTEQSSSWVEYHIDDIDNNVLYAGKAYPIDNKISFLVNQVVYNYLTDFPLENKTFTPAGDYSKIFYLKTSTGNITAYNFKNDWSYKYNSLYTNSPCKIVNPEQYFIISGDYNYKFNIAGKEYTFDSIGTYKINLANLAIPCGEKIKVYFKDQLIKEYLVSDSSDFVLYYTNSTGAWDFITLKANTTRKDNITSSTYERRPVRPSNSFGVVKYQNIIKPSWELNTGWIKGNIADLTSSLNVYLYNIKEKEFIPVVITDTDTEYKDYTNNGKHLVNYTINIEGSQVNERH